MILAVVLDQTGFSQAMSVLDANPNLPIWMIYPKGKAAQPSDAEIRSHLRGMGLIDTKSCAVSAQLTATRYIRRK